MITFKDFLELVKYRIIKGNKYHYKCFGENAWCVEYNNSLPDVLDEYGNVKLPNLFIKCMYDYTTQEVFGVVIADDVMGYAYRWIHPDYREAFKSENNAWLDEADIDEIVVDLETSNDFLSKAFAIRDNKRFDKTIEVSFDLTEQEALFFYNESRKAGITIDEYIENVLKVVVESENQDGSKPK